MNAHPARIAVPDPPATVAAEAPPRMREALQDARVLIVDDSAATRITIRQFLLRSGLRNVSEAPDGIAALEDMECHKPDLIITDLLMPRLDGLALCRQIRADPRWKDVPILVQSGTISVADRADVFFNGATDLVAKPLNLRELFGRVQVHLEQRWLINELSAHQRALSRDLELAREMQEALLPDDRAIRSIEDRFPLRLAHRYRASQQLGGDLWRIRPNPLGSIDVEMTDFAGHGIAAALNTFRLDSFQRGHQLARMPLEEAFSMLNAFLCDTLPLGQYATHIAIRMDLEKGEIELCSAGGPPPMLDPGGSGQFEALPSAGIPLGLVRDARHQVTRHAFPPGSRLFLYSDGLVETPLAPDSVFDTESLTDFLSRIPPRMHPAVMIAEVERALQPHVPEDDLTIVALKRRSEP